MMKPFWQNGLHITKVFPGLKAIFLMDLRFDPKLIFHYIRRYLSESILWAVLLHDRILSAFSSEDI